MAEQTSQDDEGRADAQPEGARPDDAPKPRRGRPRKAQATPDDGVTVIKKYANRRLYNTGTSTYVTLEDLAAMVREGQEFVVQDAKTGEDITRPVLGQIIFEQEAKEGQSLLPTEFLRQVISYYGDQMGAVVPSYLEQSMAAFERTQGEMRAELGKLMEGQVPDPGKLIGGVGAGMNEVAAAPLKAIEQQTRRNAEMFTEAMRMFSPFGATGAMGGASRREAPQKGDEAPAAEARGQADEAPDELAELRGQIAAMQRKVDKLSE